MFKDILLSSKNNIIVMMLVMLASGMFSAAAYWYRASEEANKQVANRELQSILAKYELAKKNSEILQIYNSEYQRLKSRGLIESEDRLTWINSIEQIVSNNQISSVQYKIDKQEKYTESDLGRVYPDIDVFKSNMTIDMDLLHEGDLYVFFNELKNNVKGFFEIKSCDLSAQVKTLDSILESISDSNLKAKCHVNWYSIKSRSI